jgi:hypothetical protein
MTLIISDIQKSVVFITKKIAHIRSQTIYQRLIGEQIRVLLAFHLLMLSVYALAIPSLDIQHYAFLIATGKRFFAPITEPKRTLDIGTGTGTWMLASIYIIYAISAFY